MQGQEGLRRSTSQGSRPQPHDILNHPLTFRDVVMFVAEAQQYFLDIMAFLDYVLDILPHITHPPFIPLPVRSQWMGCFTADTKVCDELFHAGVPVWLVQHNFTITLRIIIEKLVRFTFPDGIICSMYSEGGKPARPFDCLYRRPGGLHHHLHTWHHYTATVQPSIPVPQASSSQMQFLVKWAKCLLKRKQGEPRKRSMRNPTQVSGP